MGNGGKAATKSKGSAKSAAGMPKNKIKRKNRGKGQVVVSGDIAVLQATPRFAPGVETCLIRFSHHREKPGTKVELIITDKDGKQVNYRDETVADLMHGTGDRSGTWEWDGKDDKGKWVSPVISPFTVKIKHASGLSATRQVAVEIGRITLWTEASINANCVVMNDPERKIPVFATVYLKRTIGSDVLTSIPMEVSFLFTDPPPANTNKTASFKYQTGPEKFLGKKGDAAAIHWEKDPGWTTSSDDGFKTKTKVAVETKAGSNQGKTKIFFKPSGVGGDDYKIAAAIYASDGATKVGSADGDAFTVWRRVEFKNIFEMSGMTHVSTHSAPANISPVFDPAKVRYAVGTPQNIPADKKIKYIGLWKDTATTWRQQWANLTPKKADETPTNDEINKAKYAGTNPASITARTNARNAIIAKAQRWVNRIDSELNNSESKWFTDAGVAKDALVSIEYYHPKYSHAGGDWATSEWKLGEASTPAWLRVTAFGGNYRNLDPDGLWNNWAGMSHGNGIVTVPVNAASSAVLIKKVICHEVGHATSSQFKRDVFGPSLDHSAANGGIMFWETGGMGTAFSDREKKILRGINP